MSFEYFLIFCSVPKRAGFEFDELTFVKQKQTKLEAKGDTKHLYNTINGLIKRSKTNPLPEGQSDKELADYFSEFFYNKIKKIADKLKDIPDYIPPKRSVEQLSEFGLVDEDILNKVLIKLGNKQCELDKFRVKFINKHKKELLPVFLEIINNSLQSGSFPENCKNALVKPLIKKLKVIIDLYPT